ncbi:hypothetical protein IscW_ISCW018249 [Ixodes scapularis]|uniref:Uncharacterized protein n=1 Tax=Ixodes scapularis TaxID=6945 RepID=B7PHQ6_IXOSC|nr:hypothetical protein IscW_ISCW018249 [Ixodes scapularis]|eukprot:XP_002403376.1 hypothetical protein IscW_ISCW018249 [Ixodes scapularis]
MPPSALNRSSDSTLPNASLGEDLGTWPEVAATTRCCGVSSIGMDKDRGVRPDSGDANRCGASATGVPASSGPPDGPDVVGGGGEVGGT